MATFDDMCKECFNNLKSLKLERINLRGKIEKGYPNIEDNIKNLKSVLEQLYTYSERGIVLKYDPKSETNSLLKQEKELVLIFYINRNTREINKKGNSSYSIEKALNTLKSELLPSLKELYIKDNKTNYSNINDIEEFIEKAENILVKSKKKEEKDLKDISEYVAFALETTGLNPYTSEILEIGAVKINHGEIVESFQSLVKPEKKISKKITSINGISNEMVENESNMYAVLPEFIKFIEKLPLVAHNAEFDYSFLCANYEKIFQKKFKRKNTCTMKLYKKEYKESWDKYPQSASLQSCIDDLLSADDINENSRYSHRALNYATMAYKVYEKLLHPND
jgi:DNA polymerase-3 subunit epsilon